MPRPAGEGRVRGDVLSPGEGWGVSIRAAKAFLGWGDRITAGSDVTVSVSLGSRECGVGMFGLLVESRSTGEGATATVGRLFRDSDFRGSSGAFSSGGVFGDSGGIDDMTFGVEGWRLSVFRYSGVGSRLNEVYTCLETSSLLESSDVSPRFLFFNFASLFPIKSGCGGAGREGTGFRPPEMLRGSWG